MHTRYHTILLSTLVLCFPVAEATGNSFKLAPILGASIFGFAAIGALVIYYFAKKNQDIPQIKKASLQDKSIQEEVVPAPRERSISSEGGSVALANNFEQQQLDEQKKKKEEEDLKRLDELKRLEEAAALILREKLEEERRELEREKEKEREIEREREEKRKLQIETERKERELAEKKELEREKELQQQREREIELERQRQREADIQRQREEIERLKEIEREKEAERKKQEELERQREIERLKEIEKEKELEREKELQQQREREKELEREAERKKQEELELERQREIGKQREAEIKREREAIERQNEIEKLSEKDLQTSTSTPDIQPNFDSLVLPDPKEDATKKFESPSKLKRKAGSHLDILSSPDSPSRLRRSPSFSDMTRPDLENINLENDVPDTSFEPETRFERERSFSESASAPPNITFDNLPNNNEPVIPHPKNVLYPTRGVQCSVCRGSIFGKPIETPSGRKFHPRCFTCAKCQKKIGGKYFPYEHPPNAPSTHVEWFLCESCSEYLKTRTRPTFIRKNSQK